MKILRSLPFCYVFAAVALSGTADLRAQVQLRITEVNLAARTVEVTNFGATSVNTSGWFFCHRFSYPGLTGTIAPGASRQYAVTFLQSGSDLCLYSSNANFDNKDLMHDFIQWGSGGNGRQAVAVSKGIWTAGFFLAIPPSGKSYHARGLSTTGLRTTNWFVGWPHAGFPVPDINFESVVLTGGEWRIVAQSFYLTNAHGADVQSGLAGAWVPVVAPAITELGNGRIDVRFPATGSRQFTRLRAQF